MNGEPAPVVVAVATRLVIESAAVLAAVAVDGLIVADRDEALWQLRGDEWLSYGSGFEQGPILPVDLLPVRAVAVRPYA